LEKSGQNLNPNKETGNNRFQQIGNQAIVFNYKYLHNQSSAQTKPVRFNGNLCYAQKVLHRHFVANC